MPEQIYLNGKFMPRQYAFQHVEDRGNQFADAVYEAIAVYDGRLVDEDAHLKRMEFSLGELEIEFYMPMQALKLLIRDLLKRNKMTNGMLYMQISRGVKTRDHAIPIPQPKAGIYMATKFINYAGNPNHTKGISVMLTPDTRWARPDIKSVGLLPNILAKSDAIKHGHQDAVFVDEHGKLREGTSNNFYAICGNKIYQYPANGSILAGITRAGIDSLIAQTGLTKIADGFPASDLDKIDEAFLTSSSMFVMPVVKINQQMIGQGIPGSYSKQLLANYRSYALDFPVEIH